MQDLIKEKLKEIFELCQLTEEKYQIKPMGFLVDNYLRIQDDIKSYNIITAPESISLSEIVSRLKNDYEIVEVNHYSTYSEVKVANMGHFGSNQLKTIFEFNNENKIIEILASQSECNKWLYALWIAGTEIIDDLGRC